MLRLLLLRAGFTAFVFAGFTGLGAGASEAGSGTKPDISTQDLAAGIKCLPAKAIVKMARKFDTIKPEKKDSVRTVPTMHFTITQKGTKLPERVFFRTKATTEDFTVDTDGWVTDFDRIGSMDKHGEMCMQSRQFINMEDKKIGLNSEIDFDVVFNNTSGTHTMAELVDGTKDGKSHYKKMFPGPLKLLVPKMTHVGVVYRVADHAPINKAPQIFALKSGNTLDGLKIEHFDGMHVVGIDTLQALGADSLVIKGAKYQLLPIPSIEKMIDLGFVDEESENENDTFTAPIKSDDK